MVNTAYQRLDNDLNFAGYPSVFFDAGDTVMVGGTDIQSYFTSRIQAVGQRAVPDLDYRIRMDHLGGSDYQLTVKIGNGVPSNANPILPDAPEVPYSVPNNSPTIIKGVSTDPDADNMYYQFNFGDGEISDWVGPYASGDTASIQKTYQNIGSYDVTVRTKDAWDATTDWSASSSIFVTCCSDIRGNVDNDPGDNIDIADLVYFVSYSFGNPAGPAPACFEEADVDASGGHDIGDIVYLVSYSFAGGPAPLICLF